MKTKLHLTLITICMAGTICHAEVTVQYKATVARILNGHEIQVSNRVVSGGYVTKNASDVLLDGIEPMTNSAAERAAVDYLSQKLVGSEVVITEQIGDGRSYGAWVFLPGSTNSINYLLIESGLARQRNKLSVSGAMHPDIKAESERMDVGERHAREGGLGIWSISNAVDRAKPTLP
jgi:endonuclease YncB( thermonuclease family)